MSGIQAVGKTIGNITSNTIAKATKSKAATWLGNKWNKDPEGTLALATVTSIILKDGIGCVMYVTQSLNNKKIPDEKRKFVAALDLTNGVLMIAAQIAMFLAMRRYSGPIFKKLFAKSFKPDAVSNMTTRTRMAAERMEKQSKIHNSASSRKLTIEKDQKDVEKEGLDLFKFVVDIAAATIVGKRVIVPLIATPLAKKVETKMEAHKAKNADGDSFEAKLKENKEQAKTASEIIQPTFVNSGNSNLLAQFKK